MNIFLASIAGLIVIILLFLLLVGFAMSNKAQAIAVGIVAILGTLFTSYLIGTIILQHM